MQFHLHHRVARDLHKEAPMGPDGPRRLIRRTTGGQEVAGSNPASPTKDLLVSVALVLGTLSSSTGLGDELTPQPAGYCVWSGASASRIATRTASGG